MSYFYNRKSYIRLRNYNYSSNGCYFVTICTQYRLNLFGKIKGDTLILNDAGKMINNWYLNMETKFENITLDSYIIMPNHIHGIIIINSNEEISLFKIMQWFKTMTTNGYIKGVNAGLYKPFKNKLWQRGYHDHIIRTKKDFHRIQKYITENPKSWNNDRHNQQRL